MNIEEFRNYCIAKPGVTEELPFGPDTLVFKVMGKMFALSGIDDFKSFNAKCDPERCVALRAEYVGIQPGWHMNKQHWNTVLVDGSVPETLLYELLDESYRLVALSLPKKEREALKNMS